MAIINRPREQATATNQLIRFSVNGPPESQLRELRVTVHEPFQLLPGFLVGAWGIRNVFDHIRIAVKREQVIEIIHDKMPEQESLRFKNNHHHTLGDFLFHPGLL